MTFGSKRLFNKGQNNILTDGTCRTENTAVISRNHQHHHQQTEQPQRTDRQNIAQRHRQHQLIIKRTELGINSVPFVHIFGSQGTADSRQINSIIVLFIRKFGINADDVLMTGKLPHIMSNALTKLSIRHQLGSNFLSQLHTDIVGFGRKVLVIEHCDDRTGNKHIKNRPQSTAPGSQQTCHFLFVSRTRRRLGTAAVNPAHTLNKARNDRNDQHRKQVEVTQFGNIHRIDEAFVFHPVHHHRHHFISPRELIHHKDHKKRQHRVNNETLHGIGDRHSKRTAPVNNGERNRKYHQHNNMES